MENSASILIFSQATLKFESFLVKQVGENPQTRISYFQGKDQDYPNPTRSKIVQIHDNAVCIIGGYPTLPSLLTHDYDVGRSCLLLDLSTGIITEKSQMNIGRCGFGVGHINNCIYAIAGCHSDNAPERSCERYDVSANKWSLLPCQFDEFAVDVSLVVSSKRYLSVFGGTNN